MRVTKPQFHNRNKQIPKQIQKQNHKYRICNRNSTESVNFKPNCISEPGHKPKSELNTIQTWIILKHTNLNQNQNVEHEPKHWLNRKNWNLNRSVSLRILMLLLHEKLNYWVGCCCCCVREMRRKESRLRVCKMRVWKESDCSDKSAFMLAQCILSFHFYCSFLFLS